MDSVTILASLLGSTLMAALISGLVSIRINERSIKVDNITKERAKWRDKIRLISHSIYTASVSKREDDISSLHAELILHVNIITDDEDKALLSAIQKLSQDPSNADLRSEVLERFSLLLKHDWQRAKLEAEPSVWPCKKKSTERVVFEKWKNAG